MRYLRKEIRDEIVRLSVEGEPPASIARQVHRSASTIEKILAGVETGKPRAERRRVWAEGQALDVAIVQGLRDRSEPVPIPAEDRLNVLLIAIERARVSDQVNAFRFPVGEIKVGAVEYATMGMI